MKILFKFPVSLLDCEVPDLNFPNTVTKVVKFLSISVRLIYFAISLSRVITVDSVQKYAILLKMDFISRFEN